MAIRAKLIVKWEETRYYVNPRFHHWTGGFDKADMDLSKLEEQRQRRFLPTQGREKRGIRVREGRKGLESTNHSYMPAIVQTVFRTLGKILPVTPSKARLKRTAQETAKW